MSNPPVREMIHNCVKSLGGKATYEQIIKWVKQSYGNVNEGTIRAQTIACSVNQPGRVHYPENGKPRESDKRYDLFFSVGRGEVELYDPQKHGNWGIMNYNNDMVISHEGKPVRKIGPSISTYTFDDLLNYLQEMTMFRNYQPVVIKTLVENGGRSSKELVRKVLEDYNQPNPTKSMFSTVLDVLKGNNIIRDEDDNLILNTNGQLTDDESKKIIDLCNQKIEEFKNESSTKDKIAICWPTNEVGEKIEKFRDVIERHGKVLWGINWGLQSVKESDFPIKGYLYYRGNIVAVVDIAGISEHRTTSTEDLKLRPQGIGTPEDHQYYLHLTQLEPCKPFPVTMLEMWFPNTKTPTIIQQRVYVKELQDIPKTDFNIWIWSATAESWEIAKEKKIWASKIRENIRTRVKPNDKVIFYVLGTGQFQGIFEFDGEWYDATEPIWPEETDSVIYPSQIKLKPLKFGNVSVYEIAPKLKLFSDPNDKRAINLVLKGGGGYPSNNGKSISHEDYQIIFNSMSDANYALEFDDPKLAEFARILAEKKQIVLYGPPGTGKTYLARQLSSRFFSNDYLKNKKSDDVFSDLQNAHLIDIVQFHPSYSYEDFIEGIRPFSDENNSTIRYDVQDGIFKRICKEAQQVNDGDDHYFALINDYVEIPKPMRAEELGLDRSHGGGMNELLKEDFKKITDYVKTNGETIPSLLEESTFSGYFRLNTKENSPYGDIDGYRYHFSQYAHSYSKFLGAIQNGNVAVAYHDRERGGFIGVGIIYKNNYVKNPKFILIIDEINRGNLSKIFGEIIYGLEYRDQPIRTQYSEFNKNSSPLVVPSNLLIIGTMNTADRSITLFDTAIRRRFAFLELLPDYDLLVRTLGLGEKFDNTDLLNKFNSETTEGIKVKILSILALAKINEEIITKIQLGREKQVGHSYFLKLSEKPEQFYNIWKYEVIPLLEEYFYAKSEILENLLSQKIFTAIGGIKDFTVKDLEDSLTNMIKR